MVFSRLAISAIFLGCVFAITCPNSTSACALQCLTETMCDTIVNCSKNSLCSINCSAHWSCNSMEIDSLYNPSSYAARCSYDSACANAILTTRPGPGPARVLCDAFWGCVNTVVDCKSDNCLLVCNRDSDACSGTVLRCPGGANKSCGLQCNGGCRNPAVTCARYPCNITITGNQTYTKCPAGQLTCPYGVCVPANTTVCPSRCIKGDPCNTAVNGNKCTDVGTVAGGDYNCTCNAISYVGPPPYPPNNLVISCYYDASAPTPPTYAPTTRAPTTRAPSNPTSPSTSFPSSSSSAPTSPSTPPPTPQPVEGTSLTVTTYAGANCSGAVTSTQTFPRGCGNNLPSAGQFSFSRCTENFYCQVTGSGTCGGFQFSCTPSVPTNVCQQEKMFSCNVDSLFPSLSAASSLRIGGFAGVAAAVITPPIAALLLF